MTTTTALAINIPLMVLFLALWTGIPLWLVLKRPDRGPAPAMTAPAYRRTWLAQPARPAQAAQAAQSGQSGQPAYVRAQAWRADRVRMPASR